jgi:photosystem II stability/assembly factor-like uncharacterized protein
MKKIITIISILVICIVSTMLIFNGKSEESLSIPPMFISDEGQEFTAERAKWELNRYKDPATGKIPTGIRAAELNFVTKNFPKSKDQTSLQGSDWIRRGPFDIGGRTRALAFDVRNENIILAGGVSGGMWRSTDAGTTWTRTTSPDQLQSVSTITQDIREGHEDTWYYGTGEKWANSANLPGDGIFKSTDNGQSWARVEGTYTNTPNEDREAFNYTWRLIMDHTATNPAGVLYAACANHGIFKSNDGGNNWQECISSGGYFAEINISQSGRLYATLSNKYVSQQQNFGIFTSVGGNNWTNITPEGYPSKVCRIVSAIAPSDERQVYFVAETPNSGLLTTNSRGSEMWHSFWKMTDISEAGDLSKVEWENRSQHLPRPDMLRGQINSQQSYNLCLHVKPDNPDVVFLGAVTVYRANDGFKTHENWDWIGGTCPYENDQCEYYYRYENHHADNHKILFSPSDPNVMFTASDGGVHKTMDCMAETVEWTSLNNNYFTTQFYCIGIDHGTPNSEILIGGMQDNGSIWLQTSQETEKSNETTRGDGFWCQIPDGANVLYSSINTSKQPKVKIWRSVMNVDGTLDYKTRIDPIGGKDFIWNTPYILDPNNSERMYVAGGQIIWRNNDLSQIPFEPTTDSVSIEWDSLTHTRIAASGNSKEITALEVSKSNPANVLYYGTNEGNIYRVDNAHEGNPEVIDITIPAFSGANLSCIAINPLNGYKAVAVFSNYNMISLFYTENGGETWEAISGNLEEYASGNGAGPSIRWVEILKTENDELIYLAGTSTGLYSTKFLNGPGTVWKHESQDLIGNMVIDVIDARHSDQYVLVGTHGGGMFATNFEFTSTTPVTPLLQKPANNTGGVLSSDTLSWATPISALVIDTYDLQVSTTEDFSGNVTEYKGLKEFEFEVRNFEQGAVDYFWRVRAVNAGGASDYSEVFKFTTACSAPENIYPEKSQKGVSPDNIEFVWSEPKSATKYHLQIGTNMNMTEFVFDGTVENNKYSAEGLFMEQKRYYWRIAAGNEFGFGEFSPVYNFKTGYGVGIEEENKASSNIYPNPASEGITCEFETLKSTTCTVSIRNSKGEYVLHPQTNFFVFGKNSISLNVSELANGIYYLTIEKTGQNVETLPFVIKK